MRKTIVLSALLVLAACSPEPADPLGAARVALAGQNLDAARTGLLAALKGTPDNPELLELLADVQLRMGDATGARATLGRLEAAGGQGLRFDQLLAEALLKSGKPAEALERLGENTAPDSIRIRAAALLALEDPAGAVALWQAATAAGIGQAGLRMAYDYGSYLAQAGELAAARRVVEQMQAAAATAFETLQLEGKVALVGGDAKAAQARFAAAAERYPNRIEPFCGQAEALDFAGQIEPALKLLAAAEIRMPAQPCVTEIRLSLLAQQGEWSKIRDILQDREAELDPASTLGMTYAEALLRLGRPEQARALFNRALLASPQNPYSRLMLAEAQLETGDGVDALDTIAPLANSVLAGERELQLALRAARSIDDPSATDYAARLEAGQWRKAQDVNAAGLAAVARQDWGAAINAWQQLDAPGSDPEIQRRLVFALSRASRHADAVARADRLLALQPDNPDAVYLAGLARTAGGIEAAKGLTLLEKAVRQQPDNWQFRQALAKARAAAG